MLSELKDLWRFRELLLTMVERELRIRYKNSVLGFFWSMLNPLITVLVMSFVFQNFMADRVHNATAYLLAAYLPFTFFQLCLMDSAQTILVAMPLIKKIYLPREILPIASVISNFIHLLMAMVMFFVYLLGVYLIHPGQWPFQATSLMLPFLLLINLCLSLGLSLFISAFNTFYEDVKYIVGVATYLMFFLCPILYFEERVANTELNLAWGGKLYMVMNMNPMFTLSNAYRKLLLAPMKVEVNGHLVDPLPLDWRYVGLAALVSILILISGYSTFNRLKWKFVERP